MLKKALYCIIPSLREIKKIEETETKADLLDAENMLYAYILGPILYVLAMVTFILGLTWNEPTLSVCLFSLLYVFFGWLLITLSKTSFSYFIKVHLSSLITLIGFGSVMIFYLHRFGILIWFFLFFLSLLTIQRTDKTLISYILIGYVLLYIHMSTTAPKQPVLYDRDFFLVMGIILSILMSILILMNQLYSRVILKKMDRFKEVSEQKEEIYALYEEITAIEEELRFQNEQLMDYNKQITTSEERLRYLAYNDPLTELPNRKMIVEQLQLMIEMNTKPLTPFAIVFIDLDNFKTINDTLGHFVGDALLCQVSNRLLSQVNKKDTLGRLGGDELALIIKQNLRKEVLLQYAQRLCSIFQHPFSLDGKEVAITASFGIAIFPEDAINADDLLKAADTAMYKAKEIGKNNVQFYQKSMKEDLLHKIELEKNMILAIKRREFYLVYQPKFQTSTKKLLGFEALIRWNSLDQGLISPLEFIPLAEETGIIHAIGAWVLQEACEQIRSVEMQYGVSLPISVNVSAVQMRNKDFAKKVSSIVKDSRINPSNLELELTESVFIQHLEQAAQMIYDFKNIGINIALDDFGTGYSSLSYLTKLPIDTLKLDKSFIDDLFTAKNRQAIVGNIISLVHSIDMTVVAEGVETQAQLDFLEQESCDLVQGFLLGKPIKKEELQELLNQYYT